MTTHHVYAISSSLEEDRPEIDFELPENQIDWNCIGPILAGKRGVESYHTPDFVVRADDAVLWDFYYLGA